MKYHAFGEKDKTNQKGLSLPIGGLDFFAASQALNTCGKDHRWVSSVGRKKTPIWVRVFLVRSDQASFGVPNTRDKLLYCIRDQEGYYPLLHV